MGEFYIFAYIFNKENMRILIIGAGKMGTFLTDALCTTHDVALYDKDMTRLRFVFNTRRLCHLEEIKDFQPELLINAVTIKYTIDAFNEVIPYLPKTCIISDIASVKTGIPEFYKSTGMRFVSTHPMFGPTFANLSDLSTQNAIIISEGDNEGKKFFRDFYQSLHLNIFDYTFIEHDETTAYSLSIPFATTLAFASSIKPINAPGTTFKRHMAIAHGFLNEDSYLISEVLFNPFSSEHIAQLRDTLTELLDIIEKKDKNKLDSLVRNAKKNTGS